MSAKTHYRKVFKSDHLGVADLEEMTESGSDLIFEIKQVKQEYGTKVAGKKIDANIAYFKEKIKPLVLNATNSKALKSFTNSSFVEDWSGLRIRLEINSNVKMKGEIVGGVRISKTQPSKEKPVLDQSSTKWGKAKEAVVSGSATIETIRQHYSITDSNFVLLSS